MGKRRTAKTRTQLLAAMRTAAQLRALDRLVILSHGMGVETAAILKLWIERPELRPFTSWKRVIVITSQVGEEVRNSITLMERFQLPELKKLGVRFIEVARKGHLEKDGIVVLQDTAAPEKLHPEGVWKLSDELLHAGTVPQFSGEHRCALKFKAFVIEALLAWLLRGEKAVHVWGYNAQELSRIEKSEEYVALHNRERTIPVKSKDRQPVIVFGFNNDELGRIERSMEYDGPERIGYYPLLELGWGREECLTFLQEQYGVVWIKSACAGCPFNEEAYNKTDLGIQRFLDHPDQAAHWLFVEYVSLCFNEQGRLYANGSMNRLVVREPRLAAVLAEFNARLTRETWALYEVRRIFTVNRTSDGNAKRVAEGKEPKETVARAVRPLATGTHRDMAELFAERAAGLSLDRDEHGIVKAYFARRRQGTPTGEGFYVIAPYTVKEKVNGPMAVFDRRFEDYTRKGPVALPVLAADEDYFGV